MRYQYLLFILIILFLTNCEKILPEPALSEQILDGPIEGLTSEETLRFLKGDKLFNEDVFITETGLGPIFVANSCGSCHAGDGKGHPFSTITRFGQVDSTGNTFLAFGGPQLQNNAILGYVAENIPTGASFTKILPPANTGLGYLDAVSDQDIIDMSDPDDADGDGVSGVPNWISVPAYCQLRPSAISQNNRYIGRFGKKASTYDLLQQTASAYNQDMGINSSFENKDTYSGLVVEPEISNSNIYDLVFYLKTLKAPIPRMSNVEVISKGKELFFAIGCESCHKATLKTGPSQISVLSEVEFSPYTDLLLHDMGSSLDDHYTEGTAKSSEWRTPALWGLGLSKDSQGGDYYLLHDGRANSIQDAINWHGGEGESSKVNYLNLTPEQRSNLISFLESL